MKNWISFLLLIILLPVMVVPMFFIGQQSEVSSGVRVAIIGCIVGIAVSSGIMAAIFSKYGVLVAIYWPIWVIFMTLFFSVLGLLYLVARLPEIALSIQFAESHVYFNDVRPVLAVLLPMLAMLIGITARNRNVEKMIGLST